MEILRATLGLKPADYVIEGKLAEIAFGEWEGLTYAEVTARDEQVIAARESDRWGFAPPGGESYAQVGGRIRDWYERLERDTVVAAHGGTARALIAHLGLAPPAGCRAVFHRSGRGLSLRGEGAHAVRVIQTGHLR